MPKSTALQSVPFTDLTVIVMSAESGFPPFWAAMSMVFLDAVVTFSIV